MLGTFYSNTFLLLFCFVLWDRGLNLGPLRLTSKPLFYQAVFPAPTATLIFKAAAKTQA